MDTGKSLNQIFSSRANEIWINHGDLFANRGACSGTRHRSHHTCDTIFFLFCFFVYFYFNHMALAIQFYYVTINYFAETTENCTSYAFLMSCWWCGWGGWRYSQIARDRKMSFYVTWTIEHIQDANIDLVCTIGHTTRLHADMLIWKL